MYGHFRGKKLGITGNVATIEIDGTGLAFDVLLSQRVLEQSIDDTLSIWIHHHKTDISETLFGFVDITERTLFRELLRVNGIGGKTALSLLALGTEPLMKAIHLEDDVFLSSVPGIGKKTAQKIIVDLKGSIDFTRKDDTGKMSTTSRSNTSIISTLVQMGYEKIKVTEVIESLGEEKTVEEKTREAIKILSHS